MKDDIFLKLPIELQYDLQNLVQEGENGWSRDWNDRAIAIIFELNRLRDNDEITVNEWKYIHKKYLKSIGKIGGTTCDFFNFLLEGVR